MLNIFLSFSHNSRKVRELWWHGLPSSVRGEIWNLAIGNQLNMTEGNVFFSMNLWCSMTLNCSCC